MNSVLSTLTKDEAGRVVDRLAGLEEVISPELVRQAVLDSGLVQQRRCPLTYDVMMWVVIAMGLFTDVPIRTVFRSGRRFRERDRVPSRSALCRARQRLGSHPLRQLFSLVVSLQARADVPGGFAQGYRLMGIDGTLFNTPDTPANERAFGRPRGGTSVDKQGGGFPQVGKVSLVELGTHIEQAFVVRALHQGEPTMARRLVKHLTPEMLVLLDAGCYGYPLLQAILQSGAQLLINVPSVPLLEPKQELADGSYLATIHPHVRDRKQDRRGRVVRVIRYVLNDPQRAGHGKVHRLVTSLLDEQRHPAIDLIPLYHERWEHELAFGEQKTHQDPQRATKPTHLRSETPGGVVQELTALSLAHFVVRKVLFDAARRTGCDSDRVSFSGTIRILRLRLPDCPSASNLPTRVWYEKLLCEIATEYLEPRRNRTNPRVLKRARRKWPTKKRHHYRPSPLCKTFSESVVVT